jgi:hypothetical protein
MIIVAWAGVWCNTKASGRYRTDELKKVNFRARQGTFLYSHSRELSEHIYKFLYNLKLISR